MTHPSGTVTFLFTDIEGSTKLAQEHPDKWESVREKHHNILQSAMDAHNGYVFQIVGDAFCVAFHTASDGLHAAIDAQRKLPSENWGDTPIKVRMGIHTGEAQLQTTGDYHGYLAMSRVQRLMSAGHGGQVLVSQATQELIRDDLPKDISLRDLGEKRLKDLIRPEHIYQLVIFNLLVDFPPLKTLDIYRHNLPPQLTSFIGREKEMMEVKQALAEHRLVTLTGSGGAGKTRLSLQVAADLLDSFPNGIWFVELAPITDPDLIPQTILSAADMQTQQGRSAVDSLMDFLREKTSLLILDNCEHLIEACAKLADTLLHTAPKLKILASSREALGVKGEQAWHVPSLSIPDVKHLPVLEQLSQYEAVRLFIDRAALVQPHFAVTNDNAPAVAQICLRLDGIPLAIELAAARVKVLKAEQIAERLNDRFHLLTGGSRTALPRQQTLRALIDWSYDLLSENEKLLIRRLSVFIDGWTLEAAEQVCSDEHIHAEDVLDLLTHLVDKSLVVIDEGKSQLRYRMLETVRQYAREKLLESGEGEKIRTQHLTYFLNLTEEAEPHLDHTEQLEWLERLELDHDNLRTALEWAKEGSKTIEGLRLATALWRYWYLHSYIAEGYEWLIQTLQEEDNSTLSLNVRAKALYRAAHLAFFKGETLERIRILLEESRELNQKLSDDDGYAFTLLLMAWLYEPQEGMKLYKQALEYALRTRSLWLIAGIYLNMANTEVELGDNKQFILYLDECVSLYRKMGDRWGLAYSLWNRAISNRLSSNYAAMESLLSESLSYFTELGYKVGIRTILLEQANLAFLRRNYKQASLLCEKILVFAREIGHRGDELTALRRLGHITCLTGDYNKARSLLVEASTGAKEINNQELIGSCLEEFAVLAVVHGEAKRSAALFGATEIHRKTIHHVLLAIDSIEVDKDIAAARAQLDEAAFNAAWAEGCAMTLEQAIDYALTELGQ